MKSRFSQQKKPKYYLDCYIEFSPIYSFLIRFRWLVSREPNMCVCVHDRLIELWLSSVFFFFSFSWSLVPFYSLLACSIFCYPFLPPVIFIFFIFHLANLFNIYFSFFFSLIYLFKLPYYMFSCFISSSNTGHADQFLGLTAHNI